MTLKGPLLSLEGPPLWRDHVIPQFVDQSYFASVGQPFPIFSLLLLATRYQELIRLSFAGSV
jgi:hypothetical protein